jgi:two-component system invasion response regulator UvrY
MLKVLIADDHAIVRKGLIEILRESPNPAFVGEAADGRQALDKIRAHPWDLVILDITMPGLSGLEVLREIKREQPGLPVVMLSMHTGSQYVQGSLRTGASGYLSKETAPEELLEAIQTVIGGGIYLSRDLRPV